MSKSGVFGRITVRRSKYKRVVVEGTVRSWRARLAEWLLKRDILDLEADVREEFGRKYKEKFDKDVLDQTNDILRTFIDDYKRQLDQGVLNELDMYELQFDAKWDPTGKFGDGDIKEIETKNITTAQGDIKIPKRFVKRKKGRSLKDKLDSLSEEFNIPSITTWSQGKFIDSPRYKYMSTIAKSTHDHIEKTSIRPGGGTNNALFRVTNTNLDEIIPKYLEKVAAVLDKETKG